MYDAPVGGGDVGGASNPSGADIGTGGASNPSAAGSANTTGLGGTFKANNFDNLTFAQALSYANCLAHHRSCPIDFFDFSILEKEYLDMHKNLILYNAKSPLDQFEIRNLISLDVPILGYLRIFVTNIAFYLIIATVIALAFNLLGTNKDKIVANH
jgi:hypothetical protein